MDPVLRAIIRSNIPRDVRSEINSKVRGKRGISDHEASDSRSECEYGGCCGGLGRWRVDKVFATDAEGDDIDNEDWYPRQTFVPS